MQALRRSCLAAALLLALPAAAQTVTDGDTIKLDGTTYRIWGIDALETHQACGDGWAGGVDAGAYMRELVRGKTITCEPRVKDRYGRTVALCRANGEDLGAAMVRAGMAYAFIRYSSDYVADEATAKASGLGVHAHQCEKPWDWRARVRGDR